MIEDLYERMHRFRLLCRVNFISHFTSKKGNPCTKLMLVDERGDEIACIIYDKPSERSEGEKLLLLKGRTYLFENGDVEKN